MKSVQKVFGKRDVLKLKIKGDIGHLPVFVWVRRGTSDLRLWNADTRLEKIVTINQLPGYDEFFVNTVFISADTVLICGGRYHD